MKNLTIGMPVLAIIFSMTVGCQKSNQEIIQEKKSYVKVARVEGDEQSSNYTFHGEVREKRLVDISFRVPGQLATLTVDEGDYVKEGQTIGTLDKRDYQLQAETTQAQYEQVKAEYKRYQELYESDKLPANSFDKSESGYKMAKIAFQNAQNQLADTDLKSPFSGYIYEKKAENYQTVGAGKPIVSIIDKSSFEIVIGVPENLVNQISEGIQHTVSIENASISNYPVELISIAEKSRPDGLYNVKLSLLTTEDLSVSPGMSAQVMINCADTNTALYVPSTAIFSYEEKSCVWVYSAQSRTVSRRSVTLKQVASNEKVVVKSGLKVGEQVIVNGVHQLVDGQSVEKLAKKSNSNIGGLL